MNEINNFGKYYPSRSRNQTRTGPNYGDNYMQSLNGYLFNPSPDKRVKKAKQLNQKIVEQQLNFSVLQRRHQLKQLDEDKRDLNSRIRKLKEQIRVNYRMILRDEDLHKSQTQLGDYEDANFPFIDQGEKYDTDLAIIAEDNDELVEKMSKIEQKKDKNERIRNLKENMPLGNIIADIRTLDKLKEIVEFQSISKSSSKVDIKDKDSRSSLIKISENSSLPHDIYEKLQNIESSEDDYHIMKPKSKSRQRKVRQQSPIRGRNRERKSEPNKRSNSNAHQKNMKSFRYKNSRLKLQTDKEASKSLGNGENSFDDTPMSQKGYKSSSARRKMDLRFNNRRNKNLLRQNADKRIQSYNPSIKIRHNQSYNDSIVEPFKKLPKIKSQRSKSRQMNGVFHKKQMKNIIDHKRKAQNSPKAYKTLMNGKHNEILATINSRNSGELSLDGSDDKDMIFQSRDFNQGKIKKNKHRGPLRLKNSDLRLMNDKGSKLRGLRKKNASQKQISGMNTADSSLKRHHSSMNPAKKIRRAKRKSLKNVSKIKKSKRNLDLPSSALTSQTETPLSSKKIKRSSKVKNIEVNLPVSEKPVLLNINLSDTDETSITPKMMPKSFLKSKAKLKKIRSKSKVRKSSKKLGRHASRKTHSKKSKTSKGSLYKGVQKQIQDSENLAKGRKTIQRSKVKRNKTKEPKNSKKIKRYIGKDNSKKKISKFSKSKSKEKINRSKSKSKERAKSKKKLKRNKSKQKRNKSKSKMRLLLNPENGFYYDQEGNIFDVDEYGNVTSLSKKSLQKLIPKVASLSGLDYKKELDEQSPSSTKSQTKQEENEINKNSDITSASADEEQEEQGDAVNLEEMAKRKELELIKAQKKERERQQRLRDQKSKVLVSNIAKDLDRKLLSEDNDNILSNEDLSTNLNILGKKFDKTDLDELSKDSKPTPRTLATNATSQGISNFKNPPMLWNPQKMTANQALFHPIDKLTPLNQENTDSPMMIEVLSPGMSHHSQLSDDVRIHSKDSPKDSDYPPVDKYMDNQTPKDQENGKFFSPAQNKYQNDQRLEIINEEKGKETSRSDSVQVRDSARFRKSARKNNLKENQAHNTKSKNSNLNAVSGAVNEPREDNKLINLNKYAEDEDQPNSFRKNIPVNDKYKKLTLNLKRSEFQLEKNDKIQESDVYNDKKVIQLQSDRTNSDDLASSRLHNYMLKNNKLQTVSDPEEAQNEEELMDIVGNMDFTGDDRIKYELDEVIEDRIDLNVRKFSSQSHLNTDMMNSNEVSRDEDSSVEPEEDEMTDFIKNLVEQNGQKLLESLENSEVDANQQVEVGDLEDADDMQSFISNMLDSNIEKLADEYVEDYLKSEIVSNEEETDTSPIKKFELPISKLQKSDSKQPLSPRLDYQKPKKKQIAKIEVIMEVEDEESYSSSDQNSRISTPKTQVIKQRPYEDDSSTMEEFISNMLNDNVEKLADKYLENTNLKQDTVWTDEIVEKRYSTISKKTQENSDSSDMKLFISNMLDSNVDKIMAQYEECHSLPTKNSTIEEGNSSPLKTPQFKDGAYPFLKMEPAPKSEFKIHQSTPIFSKGEQSIIVEESEHSDSSDSHKELKPSSGYRMIRIVDSDHELYTEDGNNNFSSPRRGSKDTKNSGPSIIENSVQLPVRKKKWNNTDPNSTPKKLRGRAYTVNSKDIDFHPHSSHNSLQLIDSQSDLRDIDQTSLDKMNNAPLEEMILPHSPTRSLKLSDSSPLPESPRNPFRKQVKDRIITTEEEELSISEFIENEMTVRAQSPTFKYHPRAVNRETLTSESGLTQSKDLLPIPTKRSKISTKYSTRRSYRSKRKLTSKEKEEHKLLMKLRKRNSSKMSIAMSIDEHGMHSRSVMSVSITSYMGSTVKKSSKDSKNNTSPMQSKNSLHSGNRRLMMRSKASTNSDQRRASLFSGVRDQKNHNGENEGSRTNRKKKSKKNRHSLKSSYQMDCPSPGTVKSIKAERISAFRRRHKPTIQVDPVDTLKLLNSSGSTEKSPLTPLEVRVPRMKKPNLRNQLNTKGMLKPQEDEYFRRRGLVNRESKAMNMIGGLNQTDLDKLKEFHIENVNKKVKNGDFDDQKVIRVGNGLYDFMFVGVEQDEEDLEEIEIGNPPKGMKHVTDYDLDQKYQFIGIKTYFYEPPGKKITKEKMSYSFTDLHTSSQPRILAFQLVYSDNEVYDRRFYGKMMGRLPESIPLDSPHLIIQEEIFPWEDRVVEYTASVQKKVGLVYLRMVTLRGMVISCGVNRYREDIDAFVVEIKRRRGMTGGVYVDNYGKIHAISFLLDKDLSCFSRSDSRTVSSDDSSSQI